MDTAYAPEIDMARRVGFLLVRAEQSLGYAPRSHTTLDERIRDVLRGAMHQPDAVSADVYAVLYKIAGRRQ